MRDSRQRRAKNEDGETIVLIIRRFKCPSCGTVHAEIPAEILPNYIYRKEIIQRAIAGIEDDRIAIFRDSLESDVGFWGEGENLRAGDYSAIVEFAFLLSARG